MKVHRINRRAPLLFHMAGYFCSPDPNWIHLSRLLTDYELMIVVKGTLFIADGNREFSVKEGEYLLLAPGSDQTVERCVSVNFSGCIFPIPSCCCPKK